MYTYIMSAPMGKLTIKGDSEAVKWIGFEDAAEASDDTIPEPVLEAVKQLEEYFAGRRKQLDLKIKYTGTPFQCAVWDALKKIPYGQTRTYGEIAAIVGKPKGARAVGMACNRNMLAIVIPCHRVVGASGKLIGYAGGLDKKAALLELERK